MIILKSVLKIERFQKILQVTLKSSRKSDEKSIMLESNMKSQLLRILWTIMLLKKNLELCHFIIPNKRIFLVKSVYEKS